MLFTPNITLIGIDTPHQTDFIIDRPHGEGCFVLMCFSTPFFTRTLTGMEFGEPGDCLLHDPLFAQYHGTPEGQKEGFRNDWIHMEGTGIKELANQFGVPLNILIRTGEKHLLSAYFRAIESELAHKKPFWQQKIGILIQDVMCLIGRQHMMKIELEQYTPSEREFKQKFIEARATIHEQFAQDWTVERMANLVRLSAERFTVLYQTFFHTSPKEDLIARRLEESKVRLINSHDSIEKISLECGFNSIYYFSRIFKKRVGCPPGYYRNRTN
ncbi:helix-turn-helix transcriptional regulator [Paenibacillus roseipurpureus]|uniref:AraC family transcriptional regulator n=1 Tax=Paenibacillus roseopurpureus TaxID=2918901 RepID=A0AA96LKP8_9BACL|nr:AraC family transcriptional regulator [Paenibacillus sp. MBLB1832]WNR42856.1 AraC family transcriptional regulator [Paenibacillus sp. MBLB1832]